MKIKTMLAVVAVLLVAGCASTPRAPAGPGECAPTYTWDSVQNRGGVNFDC